MIIIRGTILKLFKMADEMATDCKNTISLELKVLWACYYILNKGLWGPEFKYWVTIIIRSTILHIFKMADKMAANHKNTISLEVKVL